MGAAGQHAGIMSAVQIDDVSPQHLPTIVGEEWNVVGDEVSTCAPAALQAAEQLFAFTWPQPTSLTRKKGMNFRSDLKPRLAWYNALHTQQTVAVWSAQIEQFGAIVSPHKFHVLNIYGI